MEEQGALRGCWLGDTYNLGSGGTAGQDSRGGTISI